MFSWCFLSVSMYFSIVRYLSREPDFFSREPDFQEFIKKPQNMFSWCFVSVSWYFSIIRHLSREPDFSAENRIFKNFLKCLKACLVGVFCVFQSIFSIVRHLGREPDFLAENRIFKNFSKTLETCLVGVFWVFHGCLFGAWCNTDCKQELCYRLTIGTSTADLHLIHLAFPAILYFMTFYSLGQSRLASHSQYHWDRPPPSIPTELITE